MKNRFIPATGSKHEGEQNFGLLIPSGGLCGGVSSDGSCQNKQSVFQGKD